jgi:SAM-dependent methyltransferase
MIPPPRIGTPEEFAAILNFFAAAGYTEDQVWRELGIPQNSALNSASEDANPGPLTSFFLLGRPESRAVLSSHIPDVVLRALTSLRLIAEDGDKLFATVALYPVQGVYIASDRVYNIDGTEAPPTGDFVFLTITPHTRQFVELLPSTPCDSLLDLGCGAGLAAILASPHSRQVFATDITERSCVFTEFNCAMNGVTNVVVRQGDLYEPVAAETFDRIVAHMPYYPSFENLGVYVDGGDDGESITRRTIGGLPRMLRPGGRLYALTMIADRQDAPAEERVRQWMGPRNQELDVFLSVRHLIEPRRFAIESVFAGNGDVSATKAYAERFNRLGITQFVYTHLIVERHSEPRPSYTVRRLMTAETEPHDVEWLLDWERQVGQLDLSLVPTISAGAELSVRHAVRDGELVPISYEFASVRPFAVQMECRGWLAQLAVQCKGKSTIGDVMELAIRKAGVPQEQFIAAMRALISAGIVTVSHTKTAEA